MAYQDEPHLHTDTVNPGATSSWGFIEPILGCRAFSIVTTGLVTIRVNSQTKPTVSAVISPRVLRVVELGPNIELRSIHIFNQSGKPVTFTIRLVRVNLADLNDRTLPCS